MSTRARMVVYDDFRVYICTAKYSIRASALPRCLWAKFRNGLLRLKKSLTHGPLGNWVGGTMLGWVLIGYLLLLFYFFTCSYIPVPGWDWYFQLSGKVGDAVTGVFHIPPPEPKCRALFHFSWGWDDATPTAEPATAVPTATPTATTAATAVPTAMPIATATPTQVIAPTSAAIANDDAIDHGRQPQQSLPRTAGEDTFWLWPVATIGAGLLAGGIALRLKTVKAN